MIKILFLAANPSETTKLRLDEEIRAIDERLRQSEFRDRFEIQQHWAVKVSDLQSCFLRHNPTIVHFSGHGSPSKEIIVEDKQGKSQPIVSHALSQLFSVLKDDIRCVILNACYSKRQAQAIAKHIDCVIGMSKTITDSAAISFSASFYQALGYGRNIKTAFELGCGQIELEELNEQDTPKLLALKSDPGKIFLFNVPDKESSTKARKDLVRKARVKLTLVAKITSLFRLERFIYLAIIAICIFILMICIAISLITSDIGIPEIISIVGSIGIITIMTGRLINMWDKAIKLINKSDIDLGEINE